MLFILQRFFHRLGKNRAIFYSCGSFAFLYCASCRINFEHRIMCLLFCKKNKAKSNLLDYHAVLHNYQYFKFIYCVEHRNSKLGTRKYRKNKSNIRMYFISTSLLSFISCLRLEYFY